MNPSLSYSLGVSFSVKALTFLSATIVESGPDCFHPFISLITKNQQMTGEQSNDYVEFSAKRAINVESRSLSIYNQSL